MFYDKRVNGSISPVLRSDFYIPVDYFSTHRLTFSFIYNAVHYSESNNTEIFYTLEHSYSATADASSAIKASIVLQVGDNVILNSDRGLYSPIFGKLNE